MMTSLLEAIGQKSFDASSSRGFEFESDGYVFRCFPHPADDSRFVMECDVTTLNGEQLDDPALMRLLHQLNEAAWLQCGWAAMLNAEGLCFIGRTVALADTTTQPLEELIVDSIQRADALGQIIGAHIGGLPTGLAPQTDLRMFTQRA